MGKIIFLRFLFVLPIIIIFLAVVPKFNSTIASHKVFSDNFDDGNADGWVVTRNPCYYNGLPARWEVAQGKLGIKINGGSCVTEIIPNDSLWNSIGDDYIVEFDMFLVNGTDHNFAFRYTNPDNWYDFHIQSPGALILQRMNPPNIVIGNFSNNPQQPIHFKIIVQGDNLKLYINNSTSPAIENSNMGGFFPHGRIALQASAGADPNSETWFDNIKVTSIDDNNLDVPYFSQNSLPWGPTEYDHAKLLNASDPTMDRWGCVVTSAAMVLNFHNIKEFADGTPIDPGSLNVWLKNNNGYLYGEGSSGWYSYFNWPVIGTLTKKLYDAGKSSIKLVHNRAYPSNATTDLINKDLTVDKFPDILGVNNASTSSHFVVVKGKLDSTYAINDPEWNVADLSSFGNSYTQVDRYVPSNTNLSYIVIAVNPDVEVLVTDPENNKTGKYIHNGQTQVFNQIPNATYSFEGPIENPDARGNKEQLGTGVNEFLLPQPSNGKYKITLSKNANTFYTINLSTFQKDGTNSLYKKEGTLGANEDDTFSLDYSQDQNPTSERVVSFQNLIDDIKEAQSLKLINNGSANSLLAVAKNAKNNYDRGLRKVSLTELNIFERLLNALHSVPRVNIISEKTYQILLYDINYLKSHSLK